MAYCFNKINNKVLKFDVCKEIDKIRFNHYIMRKENINRLTQELEKGQFTLTISGVMKDLDLSKYMACKIIKEFEDLCIIRNVVKGSLVKAYSVYEYVLDDTVNIKSEDYKIKKAKKNSDKDLVHDLESDINIEEYSISNTYRNENSKDIDINNRCDLDNLKKENIKRELKNNNIHCSVIQYLNQKSGKNFKYTTKKNKSVIDARLNEGFVEDDFYKVIDIKCSQWLYNDMCKYLRPETLFSNKFESYLNEVVIKGEDEENIEEWNIEFNY